MKIDINITYGKPGKPANALSPDERRAAWEMLRAALIDLTGRDHMPPYRSHNYKPDSVFTRINTEQNAMLEYDETGEAWLRPITPDDDGEGGTLGDRIPFNGAIWIFEHS